MRKIILLFTTIILLSSFMSFISADTTSTILFNQQPNEVYNLGETMPVSITVSSQSGIDGNLYTYLVCNGIQKELGNIPFVIGSAGGAKDFPFEFKISKDNAGISGGTCKIKAVVLDNNKLIIVNPVTTKEFEISSQLIVQSKVEQVQYNPGQNILIQGSVTEKNGNDANGFIELNILGGNESEGLKQMGVITNGYFSINITLIKSMKAGNYLVKLDAYELNLNGEKTNTGFMSYNININQIPTSLEIVLDQKEVEPGTNAKVKAILHDQTGEKIDSTAILTIKKSDNSILQQIEKPTGEFLEYPIPYNEPPSNWTVVAVSHKLTAQQTFTIKIKKEVSVTRANDTLLITNIGNIPYQGIVLIKLGNQTIELNESLDVDEAQKYKLSAPDGNYTLDVSANGKSKLNEKVSLTGKAVELKQIKNSGINFLSHPLVWIFLIIILGLATFIVFKKGYKRSFFGRIKKKPHSKKSQIRETSVKETPSNTKINSKNTAILSLSIKGQKQESDVICIKIKNNEEIDSQKNNIPETINKIKDLAESQKAKVYENQGNIFLIFSPAVTKTFKNENSALELAQKVKEVLKHHNHLMKQKIEYGISINHGEIVGKYESGKLQFTALGDLMISSKKIASLSNEEILLSEKMKEKLGAKIRPEKHEQGNTSYYSINSIKGDSEDHKTFISGFMSRLEKENKERENKKE